MYNKFGLLIRKTHGVVPVEFSVAVRTGMWFVVETDRGQEIGQTVPILKKGTRIEKNISVKKILWLADADDLRKLENLETEEKQLFVKAAEIIKNKNIPVKIVSAELIFDHRKILFHYKVTDEKKGKKINIKELARDLGQKLGVFAEMHQIGVRGEARIISAIGCCGEELCCLRWLTKGEPITIKMAKEQNLPLNITKISGLCGRLMCCLKYELKNYQENYDKIKQVSPILDETTENKKRGALKNG